MSLHEEASSIVKKLSLEEKCKFCCGMDFWELFFADKVDIPSIMICDGPHGLRKEIKNNFDFIGSQVEKATCFPTSTAWASSFDEDLIYRVGKALGEECRTENVAVLLSPGINIKRIPICGRNFEYLSEDPYLSGKISAALIKGIQSKGVAACLKHFAANNQEKNRYTVNAIIDERALREIYLKGFEIAIKESNPWSIMMAYNRLNGKYCCQNNYLINDILRKEWNYKGCIISDWGGVNDIVESINNGLNLEMPGYNDDYYKNIEQAVKNNKIKEEILDESVTKVIELILKYKESKKIPYKCNIQEHIDLAEEVAENSAVLLKNDDKLLPGNINQNIAIIGRLAKEPVIQALGSSKVNPNTNDNACDAFIDNKCKISYAPGYSFEDDKNDKFLLKEAIEVSKDKDIVYLFVGLPKYVEAEGYDRKNMNLPKSHENLIYEIGKINKNLVVVLQCGSAIKMDWSHIPKSILLTHLSGARGGHATVNLLLGKKNPSGKLNETYANNLEDYPSFKFYPGDRNHLEYRESIFVGYRYFDTAQKEVKYPFGFGLSYTTFEYSDINVAEDKVTFTITNTGKMDGEEIAQMYVSCKSDKIYRPKKELKGFKKVFLKAGESKQVEIPFDDKTFRYFNVKTNKFEIETAEYVINIASNVEDVRISAEISIKGTEAENPYDKEKMPSYYNADIKNVDDKQFETLLGRKIPDGSWSGELSMYDAFCQLYYAKRWVGRLVYKILTSIKKKSEAKGKPDLNILFIYNMPFYALAKMTGGMVRTEIAQGIVSIWNGHFFKGVGRVIKGFFANNKANKEYEKRLLEEK